MRRSGTLPTMLRLGAVGLLLTLSVLVAVPGWPQEGETDAVGIEETVAPKVDFVLPEKEDVKKESDEIDPLIAKLKASEADNSDMNTETDFGTDSPGLSFIRVISIVLFLCGLMVMAVYVSKKYGGKGSILTGQQLGKVVGQIRISPKASLVYVETGGRILILGLTQQNVSLVSEFDADSFDAMTNTEVVAQTSPQVSGFLEQLKQRQAALQKPAVEPPPSPTTQRPMDDELESLRGDIERLQEFLKDTDGDTGEK